MRRAFEKIIISGVLIGIPAFTAVFLYPGFIRSFDYSKLLLLFTCLILVAAIQVISLFFRKKLTINFSRFKATPALIVSGMLGVIFLSTIFSDQRLNSIWGSAARSMGLITWIFLGAYFFILLLNLNSKSIQIALKIIFGTGTLIAIYGICQKFGFDPIFQNFQVDFLEGRIFSTLGNPDFLAQFLAPIIVLGFYFLLQKKWIVILPLIILLTALVLTESRASFVALIAVGIFYGFSYIKHKKRIIIGAAGFAIIFLLLTQTGLPLFDRFALNSENFRSVQSRFSLWEISLKMIADHPLLGVGPDNFAIHFPEYMTPDFYTLEDDLNITADRSHNELLDMGWTGGAPLMILYLALAGWIARETFFKKHEAIIHAIGLALLVILLQNQLSFSQITHYVLFFFLLAALVISISKEDIFEWKPTAAFRYFGTVIILIFLGFIFSETVVDRVYAEVWYTYAIATGDTKQGLQNALYLDPLNSEFRYNLLMWFPEERTTQLEAIRIIEGDTMEVLAWTANDLLETDTQAAYALFEKVIALNPLYPHTLRAYADALYINKDYEKATRYYEDYLNAAPQFWKWCQDLSTHSEYEQKKYRIFYKNVPDFNNALVHLYDAYTKSNQNEKAEAMLNDLECLAP